MAERQGNRRVALLGVGLLLTLAALTVFSLNIQERPAAAVMDTTSPPPTSQVLTNTQDNHETLVAEGAGALAATQTAKAGITATSEAKWSATDTARAPTVAAILEAKETAHVVTETATATARDDQLTAMQALVPATDIRFPLDWPVLPFSEEQLAEVREGDIAGLQESRYPQTMAEGDLLAAHVPESACDWAALAEAYAEVLRRGRIRFGGEPEPLVPTAAKFAFAQAVYRNPAFAFATREMNVTYYDAIPLVELPPVAQQAIMGAVLHFNYRDEYGYELDVSVTITEANTNPIASGTVYEYSPYSEFTFYNGTISGPGEHSWTVSGNLDPQQIQAIGQALTDLLPSQSQFRAIVACCYELPNWEAHLTFEDGTILDVRSHESTVLLGGYPMQTRINGQDYVQYSDAFQKAFAGVLEELSLPVGHVVPSEGGNLDLLQAVSGKLCGTDTWGFECLDG